MVATLADFGIAVASGARGEVRVVCPKCAHTRKPAHRNEKDLSVNVTEGTWFCHHCEWAGGLSDRSGNGYGAPLKIYERPKPIAPAPETADTRMADWFKQRGISETTLRRNQITATTRWCGPCGREVEMVAFPYFRDREHINTTYRCYEKHFSQEKNAERVFYGLDDIAPDTTEVIICEGQIDKLAFEEAGYTNVLSVPDGAPNANSRSVESKFTYMESAETLFQQFTSVILAADNDPNGRALNEELGRRIGRHRSKIVEWPEYCKDANDALLTVGPALIQKHVAEARPFPVAGIVYVNDIWDHVLDLYDRGMDPGLKLGWPLLDQHYRVKPGLMTILTGHSSHGKSLWLDHILIQLARSHDWRIGVFSPENQPLQRHAANLIEILIGKPFNTVVGGAMTRDELEANRDWLDHHFAFILPDEPTIDAILKRAKVLLFQRGISGLVLDPWNEIIHSGDRGGLSETLYISEALSKIRQFARDNGVHVWVVAHPTKYLRTDGENPPTLNDISGSVNFRNKADYGISIWRNPMDTSVPSQCHIQKVRFAETGKPGMIEFRFNLRDRSLEEVK